MIMGPLERWAEGKSLLVAMVAHQVANGINDSEELLRLVAEKPSLAWALAKNIQPETWAMLYESPERIATAFLEAAAAMGALDGMPVPSAEPVVSPRWIRRVVLWHNRIIRGRGDMVERSVEFICADYYHRKHLPELAEAKGNGEAMPKAAQESLSTPEIVFALGVAAPCWLQYQCSPWALQDQACAGDFESFERLLTIDPMADRSPRLAKRMYDILQENPEQYAALQKAKGKVRKKLHSRVALKYLLGAFLMKLSHALQRIFNGELFFAILEQITPAENQAELAIEIKRARATAARHPPKRRLSAAAMRQLYDAVAQAAGLGVFDPDFVQAPEAAERQFRRKADCWPELWKSDKTRAA